MLRQFLNTRHPFLMQAAGGLIALIIMIPVGIWVVADVLSAPPPSAAPTYSTPSNTDTNPAPATGSGGGHNAAANGAPGSNARKGTVGSSKQPTCTTSVCTVKMEQGPNGSFVFNPATLKIKVGTTVNFVDIGGVPHNIVPNPSFNDPHNPINRPAINAQNYSVKFTQAGTYHYECQVHLPSMVAEITVVS